MKENKIENKMVKTMELMKLLGEEFVKMMKFNNALLEENLNLMKRVRELEKRK